MKKLFEGMTKQKVDTTVKKVYWDFVSTVIALGVCLLLGRWLFSIEEEYPVLARTLWIVAILLCWGLEAALRKVFRYLRNRKSKSDDKESL